MYCRIVGHFFHHVPSDKGLANLVREVNSTGGAGKSCLISESYIMIMRLGFVSSS